MVQAIFPTKLGFNLVPRSIAHRPSKLFADFQGLGWKGRNPKTNDPGHFLQVLQQNKASASSTFMNNHLWALGPYMFSSHIPPPSASLGGSQVIAALLYLVETETQTVFPPVPLSTPENWIQFYALSAIKGRVAIKGSVPYSTFKKPATLWLVPKWDAWTVHAKGFQRRIKMLELLANDSQRTWDPSQSRVSGGTRDEHWKQRTEMAWLEWPVHVSTHLTPHLTHQWICTTDWLALLRLQCPPLAWNSIHITGPTLGASSSVKLATDPWDQIWPLFLDAFQAPYLHFFHGFIFVRIQTVYCIIISIISSLLLKNPIPISIQE